MCRHCCQVTRIVKQQTEHQSTGFLSTQAHLIEIGCPQHCCIYAIWYGNQDQGCARISRGRKKGRSDSMPYLTTSCRCTTELLFATQLGALTTIRTAHHTRFTIAKIMTMKKASPTGSNLQPIVQSFVVGVPVELCSRIQWDLACCEAVFIGHQEHPPKSC